MTHPAEWYLERFNGVFSSDAYDLFNGKAKELLEKKLAKQVPQMTIKQEVTGACAAGNDLEAIGRKKFMELTGYQIAYEPETIWHSNGIMGTHLDGKYSDGNLIEWEHKTIINPQVAKDLLGLIAKTPYEKSKTIPPIFKDWYIQAQHSLACTGAKGRIIAVLNVPYVYDFVDFYGRPFIYVPRNPDVIQAIEKRCCEFWQCVKAGNLDEWQY